MKRIISVEISEELFTRVNAIAESMNYSRNAFLKKMIEIYVDDLEKEDQYQTIDQYEGH